jgi:hypothetical protein
VLPKKGGTHLGLDEHRIPLELSHVELSLTRGSASRVGKYTASPEQRNTINIQSTCVRCALPPLSRYMALGFSSCSHIMCIRAYGCIYIPCSVAPSCDPTSPSSPRQAQRETPFVILPRTSRRADRTWQSTLALNRSGQPSLHLQRARTPSPQCQGCAPLNSAQRKAAPASHPIPVRRCLCRTSPPWWALAAARSNQPLRPTFDRHSRTNMPISGCSIH